MKRTKILANLQVFLILILVLVVTSVGCAGKEEAPTPTSTPEPTLTPTSKEIRVPINAIGANRLGSLEFVLVYDPAVLEATEVDKGSLASNAMMEFSIETPGRVWVGMIDANGMNGDGTLAVISFQVIGKDEMTTSLALEKIEAYDAETLLDIITEASLGNFTAQDGSFTAPVLNFTGR